MIIPKLFSYFKGYLIITVTGSFIERFINVCTAKNILLWDITRISNNTIRCKISVKAYKMLPKITYNTGVKVKINTRCGFPFFMQKYKKRKIMIASSFMLIIFMIIINQFVWDIEIRGNERVKSSDILKVLEEEGLKIGTLKHKIDQNDLKNKAIIKLDTISWLWVDKRGSKIIVDVRERIPAPEIFNPDDYTNIVAAKDGVIDSLIVRNGVPVVETGDTVLKDTVLVTGKIPTASKPETRYLQADAKVFARIWYEEKQNFSRISTSYTQTGNKKTLYTLKFFGKDIPVFHKSAPPFEHFESDDKEHELSFFGKYLGISLKTRKYTEVTPEKRIHTEKSVAAQGAKVLNEKIEEKALPDAKLISYEDSYEVIDDKTICVTVRAEYIEDIAVKVKGEIYIPDEKEQGSD